MYTLYLPLLMATLVLTTPKAELIVVDQPAGNLLWVSDLSYEVTRFVPFENEEALWLVAHDYLAGTWFHALQPGDVVRVGNRAYIIETKNYLGARDVSPKHLYAPGYLTLQTCAGRKMLYLIGRRLYDHTE